ncbi:MAG: alpha/beta hydrolase [Chitinophagaceae bacterium]|nr:MAG: alpha/beta hydrolase [Chitinophagaceae bacterium]
MKHLLLLHGAIGTKDQMEPLAKSLSKHFLVSTINFSGHGGTAMPDKFSIPFFAEKVVAWLKQNKIDRIDIFGYSMGGYVAMYMAAHYPTFVNKVVTLGTKYNWSPVTAKKEVGMLNPEVIETKLPKFAAQLQQKHLPNDWKTVLQKTAAMLLQMGENPPLQNKDFETIENEVLLLVGDRDKMVTLEETIDIYRLLKAGCLCVLPTTAHPIELLNIHTTSLLIQDFFQ